MYNETYEDYIRSILGYPNYGATYQQQPMAANYERNDLNPEIENCYPEIYKVVYPMICKACSNNNRPITPDLVDELTNEIYLSIENDNEINVTINLTNEVGGNVENRTTNGRTTNKSSVASKEEVRENRGEDRQFRNRGLQDLIRILLIRELLGRPGRPGHRPPFPPPRPPMRPPFPPGGPGGPRPPIMPRDIDLYEI